MEEARGTQGQEKVMGRHKEKEFICKLRWRQTSPSVCKPCSEASGDPCHLGIPVPRALRKLISGV